MKDPAALKQTQMFAGWIVEWLSRDPTTQGHLAKLVLAVLSRPDTQAALVQLTKSILNDSNTRAELARLVGDMLQYDVVRRESVQLGKHVTHAVLNDPGVVDHTVKFFQKCLADSNLQRTGGQAIWNAVGYSMLPSFQFSFGSSKVPAAVVATPAGSLRQQEDVDLTPPPG